MTVYELQQRLKNYNLSREVAEAVNLARVKLADLNRAQLMQGRNSINLKIQPKYRSTSYAKWKNKRNSKPGYGVPDLFDKGNFQRLIDVKVKGKTYELFSSDIKAPMLVEKYPFALGLTAKNEEDAAKNIIMPILKTNFDNTILK